MADKPDTKRMKEELEKDNRDVADLWNDALKEYKGILGVELRPKFNSVQEMVDFGTDEMNKFHKFRHNDKKVDKLRGLFKDNLDYIQKGAQQIVAAATPAFPPAAAIGTAFTYMLTACKQVSADYDVVTSFFEDMNSFLQRITILESRLPAYPAYRNCLGDVFASLLKMCGFATKYIELGRFKKWVLNLIRGEDGELGGARKKMDTSISRLQSATEYAILGNTEKLQTMNAELQENQEMQTRMLETQTQMLETVIENQDSFHNDLISIRKLLVTFDERRKEPSRQKGTKASGQNKPPTSNRVRSWFQDMINPIIEYRNIKDFFIPETSNWIFDEPGWHTWSTQEAGSQRILMISGPPGAGKSHIAVSACDHLAEKVDGNTCVVHFYFRDTTEDLNEFHNAINWIVIQIAEQNAVLCEKINVVIAREDLELDCWDWNDIFTHLVKPLFSGPSTARLQIVFDGLDELDEYEMEELSQFLNIINSTPKLNISVLCTIRSNVLPKFEELEAASIIATKEKQLSDLKALIWHHLNNDEKLRKLSRYMKQRISSKLEEKADVMLYANHVLQQFNVLGREPVILRQLESLPGSLEEIYDADTLDLQRHAPVDQQRAMKGLLGWLAFTFRQLTLDETLSLLKLLPGHSLNLEEELQGQRLAKLLRIADSEERVEIASDQQSTNLDVLDRNDPDAAYNDGNLPLKFQERSMRSFFRDAHQGDSGLRTPASEAHRQIFITCAKVLTGTAGDVHDGLRDYAANYWVWHLFQVTLNQHTPDEQASFLEALAALLNNHNNAAAQIEALGVDYKEMTIGYQEGPILRTIAFCAQCVTNLGEAKVSPATWAWAKDTLANWKTSVVPLAKGHVANWFRATDLKSALRSYKFARSILSMTEFSNLVQDEDDAESDSDSDDDDDGVQYNKEEVISISEAFADTTTNGNAHWAVAALLEHSKHHQAALARAQKALSACADAAERFQILDLLANIYLSLDQTEEAYQSINDALSNREVSPKLLRNALVTRGKVEAELERLDEAVASYEEARHCNPEEPMPGDILRQEFEVYQNKDADAEIVGVVKSWTPMERLAWMTWKYSDDDTDDLHVDFQRAAGKAGEADFMVTAYEEVIERLDSVNSGAPIRYQLATAHWRVRGDIEAAKEVLNDILDSSTTGEWYRFTDQDPAYTLIQAVNLMADILYEQFRSTPDREVKERLFTEAKSLTQRTLAHSISSGTSELTHHTIAVARMARKMGPLREFQDGLGKAFMVCYEALIDSVGWNDAQNLNTLAEVLSNLDGLTKEARILLSAQFSELDPANTTDDNGGEKKDENGGEDDDSDNGDDDEADDDDDEEEDALPKDEGDLSKQTVGCSGECYPPVVFRAWKGRTMYQCVTCYDSFLCETCYQQRQAYNSGAKCEVGSSYCGKNHKYIKGPIEGWKGIKDGVMTIEGEEPIGFKDWLDELKESKWKKAWERFWMAEE